MRRLRLLTPLFAFAAASAAALPLTACGNSDTTAPTATATVETTTFASSLGIDLAASGWTKTSTSGGLWYRTTTAAPATAATVATGQTLSVTYAGYLSNGTQFDAGPLSVTLGAGRVIRGFEQGLVGMRVGETRRLLIPPSLGYGASVAGNGTIPGNSVLVFDVTVVSAR